MLEWGMFTPLKKEVLLPLAIEKLVTGGEGLAYWQGMPIFVPQGLPGDAVWGRVISVKPTYARALIERQEQHSIHRIAAPCSVLENCGGCQWQALQYPEQLRWKQHLLLDTMARIGRFESAHLEAITRPILGMDDPFYYRNKAQFPFHQRQGKLQGGFFAAHSHELVPLDKCYIQHERINQTFRTVKEHLQSYGILGYDEQHHQGFVRHLVVRHAFATDQTLVGLVTLKGKFDRQQAFVADLRTALPALKGVIHNFNPEKGNRILGKHSRLLWGRDYIQERLGHLIFQVSLPAFFQINPYQTPRLYDTVLDFAQLQGTERVIDAYAGTGTIALWVARYARQVTGIEVVPEAIADGRLNARLNGLNNVCFVQGEVEMHLKDILAHQSADVVLLDPPRKGCEESVFAALAAAHLAKVIYVSCHPATLARDSRYLSAAGYALTALQPVDMFPHTWHVEAVALFERE